MRTAILDYMRARECMWSAIMEVVFFALHYAIDGAALEAEQAGLSFTYQQYYIWNQDARTL